MTAALGWLATAAFSASYFTRRPASLRWIQAAAACLWIVYGLQIRALPVVAANLIVALAAVGTSLRKAPALLGAQSDNGVGAGGSPRRGVTGQSRNDDSHGRYADQS